MKNDGLHTLAVQHLMLRLKPLNRALRQAAERQAQFASRLIRPDITPLCISDEQVKFLLDRADGLAAEMQSPREPPKFTQAEAEELDSIMARAATEGAIFALDQMADQLALAPFEQDAILLCTAPELDRSYERIYAYILDDLNRRYPCIELLSSLTARSLQEELLHRRALGRYGRLRRLGLLQTFGEAPTELRQELRLAPGVFEVLIAPAQGDLCARFRDPAEVAYPAQFKLPPHIDAKAIKQLGRAIVNRSISVIGIWGKPQSGCEEAVLGIAQGTGKPLRRLLITDLQKPGSDISGELREAVNAASALQALLWIQTESFMDTEQRQFREKLTEMLVASDVPVCLTGREPWRPTALLKARPYAEFKLVTPNYQTTRAMWAGALPEVNEACLDDLAARLRLTQAEITTVARVARTRSRLKSNGQSVPVEEQLQEACAIVARKDSSHLATVVEPKRGPDDLVLPPDLHRQVLEVGRFFRSCSRVDEVWGFGRLATGRGGIKTLFTGDSGTGKTLAAEVIAGELDLPLLKVDLARVVSKWVGETEKNLATVFREAEESYCVLFFDEADSLFGKRGEVQHGTDRYANLEVGYLLQRLEDYYGLVILASNLKDNIDTAFTRRFQIVIHFPRPELDQRRRIWEIAFPKTAPMDPGIDFNLLARLDLTGAGIAGAARTAALLAADEGSKAISIKHVVRAIARQYRREARILAASELGPYAAFLSEVG